MAIFHFTVAVISRARGQRIVAVAAAHAAARLRDEYYGCVHNHLHRPGVEFTEIAAPAGAPAWVFDREQLWNRVEAAERRKDSQLARQIELSLPAELEPAQCIGLLRDYVHAEFVSKGMIADLSIRRTSLGHANARVLLTLRAAGAVSFGPKMRQWNRRNNLIEWRATWANCANLHLARAGHAVRIDHRSLDEQQIELTPSHRTGIGRRGADLEALPEHLRARFERQRRIARENGNAILQDPSIAIRALARQRQIFTVADLEQFLASRTDGTAQRDAALAAIMACSELLALDAESGGAVRYTSRDRVEAQKTLKRRAQNMTKRGDFHAVAVPGVELDAFLEFERGRWQERGKRVKDAMPAAGDALSKDDALLLTAAEMMDVKTLEKVLDTAERARATLVLVSDAQRLQTMGTMSPLHDLITSNWRPCQDTASGGPLVP